eukprot:2742155-Prymnesium_polylepis.1
MTASDDTVTVCCFRFSSAAAARAGTRARSGISNTNARTGISGAAPRDLPVRLTCVPQLLWVEFPQISYTDRLSGAPRARARDSGPAGARHAAAVRGRGSARRWGAGTAVGGRCRAVRLASAPRVHRPGRDRLRSAVPLGPGPGRVREGRGPMTG